MTNKIPILIPIKEHSERCHKKNYALLPYTASYLHLLGLSDLACVITDSEGLQDLAFSLNLKTHLETRELQQDELTSCWNYAVINDIKTFFLCPVTQPFRGSTLMQQMTDLLGQNNKWDFVTSISTVQDRNQFYVRATEGGYCFSSESKNRKGRSCKTKYMIDGALYLIKTAFLQTVLGADDPNETFWKGRFTCVENDAAFMDIDTKEDMHKFEFLREYFTKSIKICNNIYY